MTEQINSTEQVVVIRNPGDGIDRLGGNSVVAAMFVPPLTPNAVGNWRERGYPPETFITLTTAFAARGLYAPRSLWKMYQPAAAIENQQSNG